MSQSITLWGASYTQVPGVYLPKTGGGTALFSDASVTTAVESDVTSGKTFLKADGSIGTGSNSGGSGSSMHVATATTVLQSDSNVLTFEVPEPTSFAVVYEGTIATGSAYLVAAVVYDGTDLHAQTITNTSGSQVSYSSGLFYEYYDGDVKIYALEGGSFLAGTYSITYTYGGNSSNLGTADVQVGSGATSITFTGLTEEPSCWSCIFKSNFSTSSGYQRVIAIANDGSDTFGMEMDSSAHYSDAHWTTSYSNGSLTITSQGTNAGGYFHQPGYYQLTYGIGGEVEPPTIEPLTVTQNGTYQESGKAYSPVTVNVSGGTSKNVQVAQSTTRSTSTSGSEVISLTCDVAGTYEIYWTTFRSSTSGTWGSRLYINDTAYENMDTSGWNNHVQNRHVTNVSIGANQTVSVRVQSRGSSYYGYVGTLVIKQTA